MKVNEVINRVIRGKDSKEWMVIKHEDEYHVLRLKLNNCIVVWDSPILIDSVENSLLKNAGTDALFVDDNSRLFKLNIVPGQKYQYKNQQKGWFMVIQNIDNTFAIINDKGYVQSGSENLTYQAIQERLSDKILL